MGRCQVVLFLKDIAMFFKLVFVEQAFHAKLVARLLASKKRPDLFLRLECTGFLPMTSRRCSWVRSWRVIIPTTCERGDSGDDDSWYKHNPDVSPSNLVTRDSVTL